MQIAGVAYEKFLLEALRSKVFSIMIWPLLFISFGLASARENVEPEILDELMASGQHEKFAELLGIKPHLVRPDNSEERSEGSIFNQVSSLGDILLTEEQERSAIDFSAKPERRWPNGIIPYSISSSYRPANMMKILDAIMDLQRKVRNVRLVPRTMQKDYVFIFPGRGCSSEVGRKGGQQALSLQENGCLYKETIQHQLMHVMGFGHEHNRIDRDNYVRVLYENIPEQFQDQYEKVRSEDGWKDIGDYDYYSIMHFPIFAPDTNGLDAFAILQDGIDKNRLGQGQDGGVTDGDVNKINTLYA